MNKLVRFIKTAAIYFCGNVLSKLISFFLLPIYTNRLAPEQYGDYDFTVTVITLILSVAFFQVWDGMFRFSFDYDNNEEKYKIINTAFIVCLAGVLIYTMTFAVCCCFLRFTYWQYAYCYGIALAFQYMYSFAARAFLKNQLFVLSGTASTLCSGIFNIVLILAFNFDVKSLYIAQIFGCFLQIIIIEANIHILSSLSIKKADKHIIRQILKFSVPLCVSSISYWFLTGFSKLIINRTLGSFENGIYAIANSMANVAVIAVNVFQFAWNETAYMISYDNNRKKSYSKSIEILLSTIAFGYSIACLGIKFLFDYLIGADYRSAQSVVPLLMLGVTANAVAGFIGTVFMTEKRTKYILYSTAVAVIINISLCSSAVEIMGIYGVVSVLALAFVFLMSIRILQAVRFLNIEISIKNLLLILPVGTAFFIYEIAGSKSILFAAAVCFGILYLTVLKRISGINISSLINRRKK
ncbi:MAG: oligosaccharide flippase family protein [Eubacterium sp.]|nr:oligosaccharide flippase family protein [Eubacterium sp.]